MAGPNLSDANSGVLTIGFREFNLTQVRLLSLAWYRGAVSLRVAGHVACFLLEGGKNSIYSIQQHA